MKWINNSDSNTWQRMCCPLSCRDATDLIKLAKVTVKIRAFIKLKNKGGGNGEGKLCYEGSMHQFITLFVQSAGFARWKLSIVGAHKCEGSHRHTINQRLTLAKSTKTPALANELEITQHITRFISKALRPNGVVNNGGLQRCSTDGILLKYTLVANHGGHFDLSKLEKYRYK